MRTPPPKELIAPKYEQQVRSIYEYVKEAANQESSELYLAKEECAIARHTLQAHLLIYEQVLTVIKDNHAKGIKSSDEEARHHLILGLSDKIRGASKEVVDILKKAAEIEVLMSSSLDALQVVAILEQLPRLISGLIEKTLVDIVDGIHEHVIDTAMPAESRNMLLKHEFLNSMRVHAITEAVTFITNEMASQIQNVKVPGAKGDEAQGVTEDQVEEMMGTVPLDDVEEASSLPSASPVESN